MNYKIARTYRCEILWRNLLLMGFIFITASCATTQVFQPPSPPGNGKALVYFIRHSYPPYVREVRLSVNDTIMGTVANNDFISVNVPVGTNKIHLDATDGKPLSFEMKIEREEKLYVVFTGDVRKTGQSITGYNEFTIYLQWNLRASPVSNKEAELIVEGFGKQLK